MKARWWERATAGLWSDNAEDGTGPGQYSPAERHGEMTTELGREPTPEEWARESYRSGYLNALHDAEMAVSAESPPRGEDGSTSTTRSEQQTALEDGRTGAPARLRTGPER
jgi:hypothetical protein